MNSGARHQRGQAMAEFIIALAVLVPMYLAVSYLGRYGDLQQRAQQASRYAAFQRVAQPSTSKLSDATIADQMRARFFMAYDALDKSGQLRSDDSAAKVKDDQGQPALWRDLGGKALLKDPSQVSLQWQDASVGAANNAVYNAVANVAKMVGRPLPPARVAIVELNLFNRLDLASSKPVDIKIGATTAALGNGLGSAGSQDTVNTVKNLYLGRVIPSAVTMVVDAVVGVFEKDVPEFGCIKADVVAAQDGKTTRLDGVPNNSTCLK